MRISAKADYAVRALVAIAQADEGPVTAESVAAAQDIPRGFLLAILADLRRAGILRSQRGQAGGWVLARSADLVSVADVIRAVDGPLASVHGLRPEDVHYEAPADGLQRVWIAVRASLREVLENVTVAHLAAGRLPRQVRDRVQNEDAWQPH